MECKISGKFTINPIKSLDRYIQRLRIKSKRIFHLRTENFRELFLAMKRLFNMIIFIIHQTVYNIILRYQPTKMNHQIPTKVLSKFLAEDSINMYPTDSLITRINSQEIFRSSKIVSSKIRTEAGTFLPRFV